MATFPRVTSPRELVERFDARFGDKQFTPYITQIPQWWEARDRNGRTILMVGLASSKGATPDLYLRPEAQPALAYRDRSGRNLWHYMWSEIGRGGVDIRDWEGWKDVMTQVPFGPNPLTGRGLFTDLLLNHLPRREHLSSPGRTKLHYATRIGPGLEGKKGRRAQLAYWANADASDWWACPEQDAQALFSRALEAHQWPNIAINLKQDLFSDGKAFLDRAIEITSDDDPCLLPPAWRAVHALGDLLLLDEERGMQSLRDGALDGFLSPQDEGKVQRIVDRLQAKTSSAPLRPIASWWAELTRRHMEQHLPTATGQAWARTRL